MVGLMERHFVAARGGSVRLLLKNIHVRLNNSISKMDNNNTLRPELVWIEGRCYRFNESGSWSKDRGTAAYQEESMYLDNDNETEEDFEADEIDVQQLDGGKFKHSFYVAKPFFPFLIGTKGSTRKRLENETSTSISIPKFGQDGNIVLVGPSRKKVISARNKIDNLIVTSRKKLGLTHFVSIPANGESIQLEFEKFKRSVLDAEVPSRGVEESIFQKPKKLHLTIGVLVLVDKTEREEAVKALEYCKENIIAPIIRKNGPITLTVRGVEYMNDDPSEVHVLYAKVESRGEILQEIVDKIAEYYTEIGLKKKEHERVNLHLTLMNTRYRKTDDRKRDEKRETFDATRILKDHENTKFGEFVFDTVHLCQIYSTSVDGYYEITGRISVQ